MKKLLMTALIAVSVISSAFASASKNVNPRVVSKFKNDFYKATDVQWRSFSDYSCAKFVENNTTVQAFYNNNGDYVGASYQIKTEELPTRAKRIFASKYADYTVTATIRFEAVDETAYYISAENERESLVLKVIGNGILLYKRVKK